MCKEMLACCSSANDEISCNTKSSKAQGGYEELKDVTILAKMTRLNIFLSKTVFTSERSQLLRGECGSYERKVRAYAANSEYKDKGVRSKSA